MAKDIDAGGVFVRIGTKLDDFAKGFDNAKKELTGFKDIVVKHSAEIKKAGVGLAAFGTAIVGAATLLVDSAGKFEYGMAKVSTLVDTTTVDMGKFKNELLNLSKNVAKPLDDLSEGLYQALSAGVPAGESIQFIGLAAKTAISGFTETATAVEALSVITNAYGKENYSAAKAADILLQTQNLGITTVGQLGSAIGRVIPTAVNFGVEFEEVAASISAMTAAGINTNESVTSLNALMMSIAKPTDEAKKAFEELGIEYGEAALKSKGLVGILNDMKAATGGNAEEILKLIPREEALKAALSLTGKASESVNNNLIKMYQSTGVMNEAYEKMANTFENKKQILYNSLNVLKVQLGDALIPLFTQFISKIMGLINPISEWVSANKEIIMQVGEFVVKFGAIAGIIGTVITVIGTLVAVLNPVTLIIIAITTAITGLYAAIDSNLFGIKDAIINAWDYIKAFLSVGWESFANFITSSVPNFVKSALNYVVQIFIDMVQKFYAPFTWLFEKIFDIDLNEGINKMQESIANSLVSIEENDIKSFGERFSEKLQQFKDEHKDTMETMVTNTGAAVEKQKEAVVNLYDEMTAAMKAAGDENLIYEEDIMAKEKIIYDKAQVKKEEAADKAREKEVESMNQQMAQVAKIQEMTRINWEQLYDNVIDNTTQALLGKGGVKDVWESLQLGIKAELTKIAANLIKGYIKHLFDPDDNMNPFSVFGATKKMEEGIKESGGVMESVIGKMKGGFGGLLDVIKSIVSGISGLISSISSGIGGALSSLTGAVGSVVSSISGSLGGITGTIGSVASSVGGLLSGGGLAAVGSALLPVAGIAAAGYGIYKGIQALFGGGSKPRSAEDIGGEINRSMLEGDLVKAGYNQSDVSKMGNEQLYNAAMSVYQQHPEIFGTQTEEQKAYWDEYYRKQNEKQQRVSDMRSMGASDEEIQEFMNSYASGISNVPYDMIAKIHQGEMILPKKIAEAVRSGQSLGGFNIQINVTGNNISNDMDLRYITEQIKKSLMSEVSRITQFSLSS